MAPFDLLDQNQIKYVRLQWVDLSNTTRCRILPVSRFKKLTAEPFGVCCLILVGSSIPDGVDYAASGSWNYIPDLSSLRLCPYAPGHASVQGFFYQQPPLQELISPLCPRFLLASVINTAKKHHAVTFKIGFENEFTLLKVQPDGSYMPATNSSWCNPRALPSGSNVATAIEEMSDHLIAAGVDVQAFHSEAGSGQYEIVTGPAEPMEAVDNLILTKETVYNIAAKYGFKATFAPRVFLTEPGNGAHLHISLKSANGSPPAEELPTTALTSEQRAKKAEPPTLLTRIEASFLSSLLSHLPAICAISLPTAESYRRINNGMWSGGTYVAWGHQNRETTVRVCGNEGNYNFELRCLDATANPYMTVAAMLGAGLLGIEEDAKLRVKGTQEVPSKMSAGERASLGINACLPASFEEALGLLLKDEQLGRWFSVEFLRNYHAVQKTLAKSLDKAGMEEHLKEMVNAF